MENYLNVNRDRHFIFPIDGDCLDAADGEIIDNVLYINVQVHGSSKDRILVNETAAVYNERLNFFECKIALRSYRTSITYKNPDKSGDDQTISVFRLSPGTAMRKYRLSVDDNILFLQDIAKSNYKSIFENPFLALYKKAHDLYGTRVHMNIFYEYTDSCMQFFSGHKEYFNLSMMPDKYREEFKANVDWLRFSFHARANCPDYPYRDTSMDKLDNDIRMVHREMARFMGKEAMSSVTTLHWGTTNLQGVRILRNNGYRGLVGYFDLDENGAPWVAYHYPKEIVENLTNRDFWVDTSEDVTLVKCDICLNLHKLNEIVPLLDEVKKNPHKAGFIELIIHEQYFYEDYTAYIPEYSDIILSAAKWAYENKYEPSFLEDTIFNMRLSAYI